jgi:integrase
VRDSQDSRSVSRHVAGNLTWRGARRWRAELGTLGSSPVDSRPGAVQELLGHPSPQMTQRYAALGDGTLRQASNSVAVHVDRATRTGQGNAG